MMNSAYSNANNSTGSSFNNIMTSTASSVVTFVNAGFRVLRRNLAEGIAASNPESVTPATDTGTFVSSPLIGIDQNDELIESTIFRFAPKARFELDVKIGTFQRAKPNFVLPDWIEDDEIDL